MKIYIYDIPHKLLYLSHYNEIMNLIGSTWMYQLEIYIHEELKKDTTGIITKNINEADFFFVPQFATFIYEHYGTRIGYDNTPKTEYITNILQYIESNFPIIYKEKKKQHIFCFPWDYGHDVLYVAGTNSIKNKLDIITESIKLEYNNNNEEKRIIQVPVPIKNTNIKYHGDANRKNHFWVYPSNLGLMNSWDTYNLQDYCDNHKYYCSYIESNINEYECLGHKRTLEKDILMFSAGWIFENKAYSKGVRQKLMKLYNEGIFSKDVIIKFPGVDYPTYIEYCLRSIFLICPEGWSYWTPRLYTAIECRCIPIIISDEFEIPFKNGFDFSKGIIRLSPNDDLSKLEEIVSKINIKEKQEFWELHRSKLLWDNNKPIFEQDSGKLLLKELEHVKENINIV